MRNIFLGLGSNIGDKLEYLQAALKGIESLHGTSLLRTSSIYATEPVGNKNQPEFLNLVAEIESNLSPQRLLAELKSIERDLGRRQTERWGPREIDIDILYYNSTITTEKDFQVPHGEVSKRRFVLVPLAEIAPQFQDPISKISLSELLQRCPDKSAVRKTELTTRLQEH